MRFYRNFSEAFNEIKRELKEMGIKVHTKSYQNKDISQDEGMSTMELQNYVYTVLEPDYKTIELPDPNWADQDFKERVSLRALNPGQAYKLRPVWEQFLQLNGKFDYTYSERMTHTLPEVIRLLKHDINSRRAYLSIFSPARDGVDLLEHRIPCSLGYWFNFRQGKLNITYLQRSSDFFEHYRYDVYMADRLKSYVAAAVGAEPGQFCHWLGSFHCFQKDVADAF